MCITHGHMTATRSFPYRNPQTASTYRAFNDCLSCSQNDQPQTTVQFLLHEYRRTFTNSLWASVRLGRSCQVSDQTLSEQ